MEQMPLNLHVDPADDEELNAIFRCAHSVKGGAATFGFPDVAELTHPMETMQDKLRRHDLNPAEAMVDVLLASGDALKAQLAGHQGHGAESSTLRDLAAKLGKQVEMVRVGEATEPDKGLVEKITDPLTHLVRNSCDHGIETPEERIAKGKPEHGTITLIAGHQGGSVIIEVRERGLDVGDAMSASEFCSLIFAPGFSTAEQVTDVCGRGVDQMPQQNAALVDQSAAAGRQAGRREARPDPKAAAPAAPAAGGDDDGKRSDAPELQNPAPPPITRQGTARTSAWT